MGFSLFRYFIFFLLFACITLSCEKSAQDGKQFVGIFKKENRASSLPDTFKLFRQIDGQVTKAAELRYAFPDSALQILDSTLSQSFAQGYKRGINSSLMIKGLTHFEKGDYIAANESVRKAKDFISNSVEEAQWHLNTAVVLSRLEDHQQQLKHYFDALKILENSKDTMSLFYAATISNISRVWGQVEELEKRDFYYQKAINIAQINSADSLPWQDLLSNLYNIGGSYKLDDGLYSEALSLLEKSLAISNQYPMLNRRRNEALILSSNVYAQLGNMSKAYELMNKYTAVNDGKDDYTSVIVPNMVKSTISRMEKKPHQTIVYVDIALAKAKSIGMDKSPKLITLWENKLDAQLQLHAFEDAVASYAVLTNLTNVNFNTERANANRTLDFIYRTTVKDKELADNQLLLDRKNHQIYQQKIIIGFVAVILVMALLLVYIFRKRQQSQKQLFELERKSDEIKHLRSITAIEEVQKRKLGAELHDGINGSMAAIKMNLSTIRKAYPELNNTPIFLETQQMLKETTDEIRHTAHALIPEMLLQNGLNQALIAHVNRMSNALNFRIDYSFFMEDNSLSPLANLTIYRIVQELLQNILKHAKATAASVQLFATKDKISLIVEDNGLGFDVLRIPNGIGLDNVKVRVLSLHGDVDIQSTPGKHTVIRVSFNKQNLI